VEVRILHKKEKRLCGQTTQCEDWLYDRIASKCTGLTALH